MVSIGSRSGYVLGSCTGRVLIILKSFCDETDEVVVTGKLLCSPSRETRPVRQTSRRNTAGSLLNSPLEESAPTVSLPS